MPNPPPVVNPIQEAEINAYVSQKMKRNAEHLVKLNEMKLMLVSSECMTKDFLNLFKEKVPDHNQLTARNLAKQIVVVHDELVSKDSYTVKKEANDEFNKIEIREVETLHEYHKI